MRSALNNGFLFLCIGSIFIGLLRAPENYQYWDSVPLFVFFVFFRIKTWLDDAVYFHQTIRKNVFFDLGIVTAIIAWCLWAAAGYTISSPEHSYTLLATSVFLLTVWIIFDAFNGDGLGENRGRFIALNLIYVTALLFMAGKIPCISVGSPVLGWVLVAGTALDFILHGSLKNFEEEFHEKDESSS